MEIFTKHRAHDCLPGRGQGRGWGKGVLKYLSSRTGCRRRWCDNPHLWL